MTEEATRYKVDENQMGPYLKRLNTQRAILYSILFIIVMAWQIAIIYILEIEVPVYVLLISTIIIFGALYFRVLRENDRYIEFGETKYYIEEGKLIQRSDYYDRHCNFDEIAIIHKKYAGTWVLIGDVYTKIDYFIPSKWAGTKFYSSNVIFIPTITTNYAELLEKLKQLSPRAKVL